MGDDEATPLPRVDVSSLSPYVSVLVLELVDRDTESAFSALRDLVRSPATRRTRRETTLVAEGMAAPMRAEGLAEVIPPVHRVRSPPSWQIGAQGFRNEWHTLTIVMRSDDLIAVMVDRIWADRVQSWLDQPGRLIRRISGDILRVAFLRGQTKGLWLRGHHASRSNKPDAKSFAGPSLELALSSHTEGTFGLVSGRAELAARHGRRSPTGTVGTTPTKGLVWCRQTDSLDHFLDVVVDLFEEVRLARASDVSAADLHPELAEPIHDPGEVHGAYDIGFSGIDDVPTVDLDSEEATGAAAALDHMSFEVLGDNSPNFALVARAAEHTVAEFTGLVEHDRGRWLLTLSGTGGHPEAGMIHEALVRLRDLMTVRYLSGHAFSNAQMVRRRVLPARFPLWRFMDFTGFDVHKEKPSPHVSIGRNDDDSLFSWVAHHYRTGHLTCDDGSSEVADFVHLAPDGVLSLIHVKRADTRSAARDIGAGPYEQVVGQATKNLLMVQSPALLLDRLRRPGGAGHATWRDGHRVDGRAEMLTTLAEPDAVRDVEVVVVQPHVQERAYRAARAAATDPPAPATLRLYLLESLLTSASVSVAGVGGDFVVIGSSS